MNRAALLSGSAAAAIGVAVPVRSRAQTPRTVTVASVAANAGSWPVLAAEELGFFKRYGVDTQNILVQSVAAEAQQLLAGAVDLGQLSSTQVVEATQGGGGLVFFGNIMSTAPYAMVAQKEYKKYADLRGKTIMVGGINDITRIFCAKMMASGGLKPDDYDLTYAGSTVDRYAALRSGGVAATLLIPPLNLRAEDAGYNHLGTLAEVMPAFPFVGWTARQDFLAAHAGLLVDLMKAYLRGVRWVNDPVNRRAALELLQRRANISPSEAARTYDQMVGRHSIFPADGAYTDAGFGGVIDALVQLKELKPPLPAPSKFFDNRIVAAAGAQLARERSSAGSR